MAYITLVIPTCMRQFLHVCQIHIFQSCQSVSQYYIETQFYYDKSNATSAIVTTNSTLPQLSPVHETRKVTVKTILK